MFVSDPNNRVFTFPTTNLTIMTGFSIRVELTHILGSKDYY